MIPLFCMQPDRPAVLVRAATPELPAMALQQGIGGVVRVRVALDRTGAVSDAVVVSTPSHVLDHESLRAARASTFAPARRRCTGVASSYEFRVLFDANREPESPPPTPSPSPTSTPGPAPNYAQPWKLTWSTSGTFSFTDRELSSSRSYTRVDDTFPLSHRTQCRATLSAPAFERAAAALRSSHPEGWLPLYEIGIQLPLPSPSPRAAPTTPPVVDVVAVVRSQHIRPRVTDGGSSVLRLIAGTTYQTGFTYEPEPVPGRAVTAGVDALLRAFDSADAECMRRR